MTSPFLYKRQAKVLSLLKTLATTYNPRTCLLALPVIVSLARVRRRMEIIYFRIYL